MKVKLNYNLFIITQDVWVDPYSISDFLACQSCLLSAEQSLMQQVPFGSLSISFDVYCFSKDSLSHFTFLGDQHKVKEYIIVNDSFLISKLFRTLLLILFLLSCTGFSQARRGKVVRWRWPRHPVPLLWMQEGWSRDGPFQPCSWKRTTI